MTPHIDDTVYVVILHYRGMEDTRRCLAGVRRQEGVDVRVVVVDNGSVDEGWRLVEEEFPWATVLKTGANLGFAGGNNVGIRYALQRDADWVMLLNNDTEFREPGIIRALVEAAHELPAAGIMAPLVRDANNDRIQDVLLMPPSRTVPEHFRNRSKSHEVRPVRESVDEVWGAAAVAWLIPRPVLEEVGGLDEAIFMYGEDNDYCHRVRDAGRRVYIRRDVLIHHFFSSMTHRSLGSPRNRGYLPNRVYIARKHGAGVGYRLVLLIASVVSSLGLLIRGLRIADSPRTELRHWLELARALVDEALFDGRTPREPSFP